MEGKIKTFRFTAGSGIAEVIFEDGKRVPMDQGPALRMFSQVFGSLPGAVGKTIDYEVDSVGVMKSFNIVGEEDE